MNKSLLRDAILQQLRQELARQTAAAELARDEAISEESRPENKWDTHSQEAAYLAEGQARLAAEIGESITFYTTTPLPDFGAGDAIAVGALVALEDAASPPGASGRTWYLLGARAGGLEVIAGDRPVLVVTPQSPLGRQLSGKHAGDLVPAAGRSRAAVLRVAAVE